MEIQKPGAFRRQNIHMKFYYLQDNFAATKIVYLVRQYLSTEEVARKVGYKTNQSVSVV